jgi:hypothetical protein
VYYDRTRYPIELTIHDLLAVGRLGIETKPLAERGG